MDAADRVGEKVKLLRAPFQVQHYKDGKSKWKVAPDLRSKFGQIERHRNGRVKVTIQITPGEYYVTDWMMESEIANAEEAKQEPINPVMSQPRKLIAMLELNTHGTEEQMWKTYEKLKFELNLQGFKFTLSDEIQVRP